jgi:hypothetical protein
MGAQQVLRAALGLIAVCALPASAFADDGGGQQKQPASERLAPSRVANEPVIIVDLRPGDPAALTARREELATELEAIQGIAVRKDKDLEAALSGAAVDRDAVRVAAALDAARTAFGALDCKKASVAADRALDDLAARQAAGLDDGAALRTAYAYVVLCADQAGDLGTATRAASRLRALGVTSGDDVGISAATWNKLPDVDASTGDIVAVTVTTDQPDAAVWIDHARVGTAPVTVYLAAGEHVIAAGAGANRAATRTRVTGKQQAIELALSDQRGQWSEIAGLVHAWRDKVTPPTNAGLTSIMAAAKTRFAIVLAGARTAEVWGVAPGGDVAKKIDNASLDQPLELAAIIIDHATVWDGRSPDSDQPLLTETAAEREALYGNRNKRSKTKWYVYASLAGAVILGGTIIYLQDSATDTQRIVIQGP